MARSFGADATDHPDRELLVRTRRALILWEARGLGPTSSVTGAGAVREFESQLSELMRGRPALALPSGTLALRLALQTVGVTAGDAVLCGIYDWPAARAAIRSLGATPVGVDLDPQTLTIDPQDTARRLTPRTTAIVATHLFGTPADVFALRRLADPLGIPVVEDCAHALGATLDGQPVGTLGATAAFSFGPGKALDLGEGGALVLANRQLHQTAVALSQHPVRQLITGTQPRADNLTLRIHPLAAILALAELPNLQARLRDWRQRAEHARTALTTTGGITTVGWDERRTPSWYRIPVVLDDPALADTAPISLLPPAGAQLLDDSRGTDPSAPRPRYDLIRIA